MDELFSREELLEGFSSGPTKRAGAALFAIESRTAHLLAKSRQAMDRFLSEDSAKERETAYLDALALGRDKSLNVAPWHLERFAPQWSNLVPENPRIKAAIANLAGKRHRFDRQSTPRLREALGLDTPEVKRAYLELYRQPAESIYADSLGPVEKVRWAWMRLGLWLAELPPFWTVFALTLTETVGAGILALPIALSGIGPLPGLAFIWILGLVNILTMAGMAEAVSRYGEIRFGRGYLGRMTANFLGRTASGVLSLCMFTGGFLALWAFYIGFASTLEAATGARAEVWVGVLFLAGLYFLSRKTINATVSSALLVGAVNIGLILLLSIIAFFHLDLVNLKYINLPILENRLFDAALLQTAFGVVLLAFNGHMSVSNCARAVIHRDPSCRSLILGSVAAQAVAIVLYSVWVLAIGGAMAPGSLAGHSGTALIPLAEKVGPSVHILGGIYIVLGMGMGAMHRSWGLFNMVRERLAYGAELKDRLGPRLKFILSVSPIFFIFLLAQWSLFAKAESFTKPLGFLGALIVPLLGGIFPMLLLTAARRKSEAEPAVAMRFLGWPALVIAVCLLFISSYFVHGLFLWRGVQAGLALVVGTLMTGILIWFVQAGVFKKRIVLELRSDSTIADAALLSLTVEGRPLTAEATASYPGGDRIVNLAEPLDRFNSLRALEVRLDGDHPEEIKVWTHHVNPDGGSDPLPVRLTVETSGKSLEFDMMARKGQLTLPLAQGVCLVRIDFPAPDPLKVLF